MKRFVLLAAIAVLSACSKPAPAPEASASATAAAAEPLAADGKPSVGKFKITSHDGKVFMEEDKADGTYVATQDGKVVETGTWVQKDPNTFCFTKDEKDAKEECNKETVVDGKWTTTNAKGEVSTIERVG
jgi:hypothetical protein